VDYAHGKEANGDMIRRRYGALLALVCLMLLTACSGGSTSAKPPPYSEVNATPPPGLAGPALTAWHVLHDVRPARDPIAIAQALRGVTGPIPTQARSSPLNVQVGDEEAFNVPGASAPVMAKLVYSTSHAYAYVQDGATVDIGALKSSTDRFESSIYIADRRYFGNEWSPGVDDDAHITILNVTALPGGAVGQFLPADEYVTAVYPQSNQRDMVYMNIGEDALTPNTDVYDKTLANLFTRMIQWHLRPTDPAWLRAASAVLAQHINGFDASQTDPAFLAAPGTPLTNWPSRTGDAASFGAAYLFLDYFAEHYGGYPIIKQLLGDPAQAPLNFNDVLAANGYSDRFDDVFAKWVMANILNDEPQSDNSPYAYKTVTNEHATVQHAVTALPMHENNSVAQYATQYYDVTLPQGTDQTLHLKFDGADTVPLISVASPKPAGQIWWSNRGDNIDTTLTRTVDLTKLAGKTVTLHCDLWYDLEVDRDYGYVEVSTDNGTTWKTLPFTGSNNDDPNGLNVGNGLTGAPNDDGAWVAASADLSPYAGKSVLLRFETITDETVNGQGMALANIAIPQLGYTDNGTGWTTKGWLRADNVLPQTYVVQVALFKTDGSLNGVQPITIAADGTGTLDLPHAGKDIGRVVVAVSANAPATTISAKYALDLSASS
jgi:immune inhibitor A